MAHNDVCIHTAYTYLLPYCWQFLLVRYVTVRMECMDLYAMLDCEESGQCEAVCCIRTYLGIGLLAGRKKI